MNTKILLLSIFILFIIVSCKKEEDSSEKIPQFTGITILGTEYDMPEYVDTTDWRIDDKFTELECSLFDTIKFNSSLHLKKTLINTIIDPTIPKNVTFYPNPTTRNGILSAGGVSIKNIVVVDQSFNVMNKARILNNNNYTIDFSSYNLGTYRMYYVFQDSNFEIIGLGHGDIYIGSVEDLIFTIDQ